MKLLAALLFIPILAAAADLPLQPDDFAALQKIVVKEGPDWWKTLSPNGGKAKGDESPAKKKGKKQ